MAYCPKCGKEIHDDAVICVNCGCSVKEPAKATNDNNNLARFLLTFFLGFIGSFIINHTSLKPEGWKSRTCAYFFLSMITFGIYGLVASICNLGFDATKASNVGYFKN